jgi:hypothetical protein
MPSFSNLPEEGIQQVGTYPEPYSETIFSKTILKNALAPSGFATLITVSLPIPPSTRDSSVAAAHVFNRY